MKPSLIIFLFVLISSLPCFGQGSVLFRNTEPQGGDHLVYSDFVGGTKLVGTNFAAELYYGSDGADVTALVPLPSSVSYFRSPNPSGPGTWSGTLVDLPIGGVSIPITLDVRVWDSTQAASYEAAASGGGSLGPYGHSGAFQYIQLLSVPPSLDDYTMFNQPAFALVPEPPTLFFGLVGGFILLVLKSALPPRNETSGLSSDLVRGRKVVEPTQNVEAFHGVV
jgi:hypothetical protein